MKTAASFALAFAFLTTSVCIAADKPKDKAALKIGKTYTLLLKDGRVLVGTLSKQDKTSITIKGSNRSFKILRKDIEEFREAPAKPRNSTAELKRKLEEAQRKLLQAKQRQIIIQQRRGTAKTVNVRENVDPKDPKVRLLILSPKGPLLADASIYIAGKPFRHAREAIIEDILKRGDTNKDGKCTWEEILKSSRFPFLSPRFRAISANPRSLQTYINRYDLNGDKVADRYEVRRMVAELGYGASFNVQPSYSYYAQPDVKALLDTNKDGKLSAEELAAAPGRLKSRDANDNDLLEATELGGGTRTGYGFAGGGGFQRGVRLPTQGQSAFAIDEGASLASLYQILQTRYGGNSKEIVKSAFQIAPKLFAELDLNKNGKLDSGEMIALHLAKPQMLLDIRIGKDDPKAGARITSSLAGLMIDTRDRKVADRVVSLSMPGWKLRLNVPNASPYQYDYTQTANSYILRYDADKNGYIDAKDVKQLGNQARFVEQNLKNWDINGDGKVFSKEIKEFYDRMQAPQNSQVTLSIASQGPSLFAALDVSGDNRLSLREMQTAGERLKSLDRNKNGVIDPDEMPGETVLAFTQGRTAYARSGSYGVRTPPKQAARGPKWFIHMDKNGDGDVTLREFLGTKAQFDKLDTNKDGFIEPKEAAAAGKK